MNLQITRSKSLMSKPAGIPVVRSSYNNAAPHSVAGKSSHMR